MKLRKLIPTYREAIMISAFVAWFSFAPPFAKDEEPIDRNIIPSDRVMIMRRNPDLLRVDAGPDKTIFTNTRLGTNGAFVVPVSTRLRGAWWFEDGSDHWMNHDPESYQELLNRKRIQERRR